MQQKEPFFIGIDGGGTKTTGAICNRQGIVLGRFVGDSSNIFSRPIRDVILTLQEIINQLLQQADSTKTELSSLFFGLAGADRPAEKMKLEQALAPLYGSKVTIDNDAVTALYSGTFGMPGIVLIAGTGSIAYGVDTLGNRHRVGGWGYLLGDEGSGFDLGRQALTAVLRHYDGRGEITRLTPMVLEHYQLDDPSKLITHVYSGANPRKAIAEAGQLAITAAEQGDTVACRLLDEACDKLFELVTACQQKTGETGAIVLAGGLLGGGSWLARKLAQKLTSRQSHVMIPKAPPVAGALVMALTYAGISITDEVKENLTFGWQ